MSEYQEQLAVFEYAYGYAIVFDCAGSGGVDYFSKGDDLSTPYKLAADVDWFFWEEPPEIVRSLVKVEVENG